MPWAGRPGRPVDQGPLPPHAALRDTVAGASPLAPHTMTLICIVDDDPSVRVALGRLVESVGYAVETFASAREFLDSAPLGRAACLVLDVHLVGMNGFELHERLLAARAELPVIFITAHDNPSTRERLRRARGAAQLFKPIEGQALLDAIHDAVEMHPGPVEHA